MKRLLMFGCALCSAAMLACSGGQAPTAPARASAVSSGLTITAAPTGSAFGASAVDFARCLQGAGDAACLSGARLTLHAVGGAAATLSGPPQNLSTSSSGSTVTLTWSAPSSGDAVTTYIIEAGSGPGLANLANFTTNSTGTSFSASGVGAGTYYVRVRAQNAGGTSAASNESILVVGSAGCTAAPNAPAGLATAVSGSTVTLTWSAPAGGCAPTSYVLQAGSSAGSSDLANANVGATTSYVASGVGAGTYYVRVRAVNAYGQSAGSNEVMLSVGGSAPSPTPVTRWVGVSPEGMIAELNELRWCPHEYDLQLDLTSSGTAVTGTAITRLRTVSSNRCLDVLGQTATWSVKNGTVGGNTISFDLGNSGAIHFTGTYTATRMTGTFLFPQTSQTGSFAVNRQ